MPSAPSLPQKPAVSGGPPTGANISTVSIDTQPTTNSPATVKTVDLSNLEYPIVPEDITNECTQFEADVPAYLKELPKKKLEELYNDPKLLQGYLLYKYGDHYTGMRDQVSADLAQQEAFTSKRMIEYDTDVPDRVSSINVQLAEYHELLDKFNATQVETFDKLSKLAPKSLMEAVEADVARQENLCRQLVASAENHDKLDDEALATFIENYKDARQQCYLKQEKLNRMREDRVADLH